MATSKLPVKRWTRRSGGKAMTDGIRIYKAKHEVEFNGKKYRATVAVVAPANVNIIPEYRPVWRAFTAIAQEKDWQALATELAIAATTEAIRDDHPHMTVVVTHNGAHVTDLGFVTASFDVAKSVMQSILEQKHLFGKV